MLSDTYRYNHVVTEMKYINSSIAHIVTQFYCIARVAKVFESPFMLLFWGDRVTLYTPS